MSLQRLQRIQPRRFATTAPHALSPVRSVFWLVSDPSITVCWNACKDSVRLPDLIVNALGPGYRWTVWKEGGEGAFTLIPNFLVTGVVATLIGLAMIAWSLRFLHSPRGPTVFLILGVASFLTGGGVAQIVLFTLAWAVATQIVASLAFWRRLLPRSCTPTAWPLMAVDTRRGDRLVHCGVGNCSIWLCSMASRSKR